MNARPPIRALRQSLPFSDAAFGWDTFEDFFCDFLNAQPTIVLSDEGIEVRRRVIRARPFGRKGDSQHGIDLLAEMEDGEVWDFQCKHYRSWGPQNTRDAIADYDRNAPRRFLLVTREVSEECNKVVAAHPGWALWDAREINRRFRELDTSKAARVLFTHFGPGWAEAFFGLAGDGPLIGAEAKFERQLIEGHRFHHRHALIGRTELVEQLDGFVRNEKARVFILIGRGGLGKSRLLLHWSRAFNHRHPDHTLRFLSDKCEDFGPSLRSFCQPLTLAFDDAHRLDDVRRALFHELPRRENIKLVLSLRPGPIGQVMQELRGAGFDTTEIITAKPMKSLTSEQAMQLVDAALKPEFARYRHFVRSASRDCPLIAVIGAELINAGVLTSGDLLDETELQRCVFESLLDDARPVRESFGLHETDDFLRLLALIGPVKLDATFFVKAAPFLGMQLADRVTHLRDALDGVGLLHTTGAGTRVTPDLLSDHLAYTACYDHTGQSRTFAERLLAHFSPEDFPKLMQHLAEAEWRALDETPGAASVVEPLWKWFRERFEGSRFHDRSSQIQEWANIAHLQPERSLELAEIAMSLKTAPPPETEWLLGHKWDSYEHSIEWLPRMLVGVAEHHPTKLSRCFDLLWQLGRDKPADSQWQQGHPISLMGDVVTYKLWKPLDVFHAALDWFERLLIGDDWLRGQHAPGWLLSKFFEPMLATCIEENWSTGRTIHMRSHPLHLQNTAPLRDRILALVRKVLARGDERLANQAVQVLVHGCNIARFFHGDPSPEFIAAWDVERLKFLAVLEGMITSFREPLIHFHIRRSLVRFLHYGEDSAAVRSEIRKVIAAIPDTLDFRIAMAAFGNDYDDCEHISDSPEWQAVAETRWNAFNRNVADAVQLELPNAAAWLAHFGRLEVNWRSFDGFSPNFRKLVRELVEDRPDEGIAAAEFMLADPAHPLSYTYDSLVSTATKADSDARLQLVRGAAASTAESLNAAAVACCTSWRSEGSLREEAWEILRTLAISGTTRVADRIVEFVSWNEKLASVRDWDLITALSFQADEIGLAERIARCAVKLVVHRKVVPDKNSVECFLRRFESLLETEAGGSEHVFQKLADAFPVEVFLTLWRVKQARKNGSAGCNQRSYDFTCVSFPRLVNSKEVQALVSNLEERLFAGQKLNCDEVMLLRCAIQQGKTNPSSWLQAAAENVTTEEQIDVLRELGSSVGYDNPALSYPEFARALLRRARVISAGCYDLLFRRLVQIGGSRGTNNGEPDAGWAALIELIESLADRYASDSELGPLFAASLEHERSWMSRMRQDFTSHEED